MKYAIERKQDNLKLVYYNVKFVGLDVTPQNKNVTIKASKVLIADKDLINSYIKQKVNRKIDKIINYMMHILSEDDDDDSGKALDELNRLKGILINKYREYMCVSDYKAFLTKLIIIEEEFKKNYNQKMYMNYYNNYYVEPTSGRSR